MSSNSDEHEEIIGERRGYERILLQWPISSLRIIGSGSIDGRPE